MASPRTVLVAGAGFSGVVTAAQLLRSASAGPLRVVLVNRSGVMARGVAYGTNTPAHVLNVPAGRMGAAPDDLGPQLIGHLALGAANAAYEEWLRDESNDLAEVIHRVFAMTRSMADADGWPPPRSGTASPS